MCGRWSGGVRGDDNLKLVGLQLLSDQRRALVLRTTGGAVHAGRGKARAHTQWGRRARRVSSEEGAALGKGGRLAAEGRARCAVRVLRGVDSAV